MTSLKPRPNHAVYLRALRAMSPQARLRKAFELSVLSTNARIARRFAAELALASDDVGLETRRSTAKAYRTTGD